MRASDRSAIAVTISVMLASLTVTPLTQDSGFVGLSWLLIIAIGAASLGLRRIRLTNGVVLGAQVAILLFYSLSLSLTLISPTSDIGTPWFEHYTSLWGRASSTCALNRPPWSPTTA